MSLIIKSNTLLVDDPDQVSHFLSAALGVYSQEAGNLKILKNDGAEDLHERQPIVINTDDCLKEYYELLSTGIVPCTKPNYTSSGLEFALRDDHGNSYTVLEERDYVEA